LSACKQGDPIIDNNENNNSTNATLEWTKTLALPINPSISKNYMPAIDENDNIYVLLKGMTGYAIQAFDKNGKELWTKKDNVINPHNNMPTYFQNKLIFTSADKVICHNTINGDVEWEFSKPDSILSITPAIAIVNDYILITLERETAEFSYMFALNPNNGDVVNSIPVSPDREWLNIAANKNIVYLASGYLYQVTVNPNGSMKLNWSVQLPGNDPTYYINFENDLVISPDGNITFAYSENGNPSLDILISFDNNGKKIWEYERQYSSHITLDEQGNIIDGGIDDLLKIDGSTGKKIWATEPPSEYSFVKMGSYTSMVHADDGNMYCGDIYGIYGVNSNGDVKYSTYNTNISNGTPFSDITLLSNGNIIVLSMGDSNNEDNKGNIHCIKANTKGIANKGWPKRGGNAANTFNVDYK